VNEALPTCPIEQLDRLGVRLLDVGRGGGAHLLERGPQAAALGAVLRGMNDGLTHALLGGLNSGHGHLG
jgi:hypothetical protein